MWRGALVAPIRRVQRADRGALAVGYVTLLFGALLFEYSVAVPPFRGPDEGSHIGLVEGMRTELGYPGYRQLNSSWQFRRAGEIVRFNAANPNPLPADAAPRRGTRPRFSDLGPDARTERSNHVTQNPPLYYGLMAGALTSLAVLWPWAVDWSFDQVLGFSRLLNAAMLLPLPALIWWTARRLGATPAASVVGAAIPVLVPQLLHIGSVNNNDNLLTLLGAVQTALLVSLIHGWVTTRGAVLIGLVSGLSMLTKAFGLLSPLWLALAYAVVAHRSAHRPRVVKLLGVALSVAFLSGGWWWARNLVVTGVLEPSSGQSLTTPAGFTPEPAFWLARYVSWMTTRFWGWFGWFDVRIPAMASVLATGVVLVAVVIAFLRPPRGGRGRASLLIALLPIPVLLVGVGLQSYDSYRQSGVTSAIQGRYLFYGMAGLAAVAAVGVGRAVRQPLVMGTSAVVGGAVLHGLALRGMFATYWAEGAESPLSAQVRSMLAWAPWPQGAIVAGAAVVVILAIVTVAAVARLASVA